MGAKDWLRLLQEIARAWFVARYAGLPSSYEYRQEVHNKMAVFSGTVEILDPADAGHLPDTPEMHEQIKAVEDDALKALHSGVREEIAARKQDAQ